MIDSKDVLILNKINKFVLFGGGELLLYLGVILKEKNATVTVVTSDRHSKEVFNVDQTQKTLEALLIDHDIKFIISKNLDDEESDLLRQIDENTLGLSFGAAWIFKKEFINKFEGRLLNLHAARLPQDRGAGGFSWRILNGERLGMSLIHQINPGIDRGSIVIAEEYIYPVNCRLPIDYIKHTINNYKKLLLKFIHEIENVGIFELSSQPEYLSTYWPRLNTDTQGYIDWSWELNSIERFICAFDTPYSGAITFLNGNKVRIKSSYAILNDGVFHPFQNGMVYRLGGNGEVFVATAEGGLLIETVLNDKECKITREIKLGQRFYTPRLMLESALESQPIYTSTGLKEG